MQEDIKDILYIRKNIPKIFILYECELQKIY